MNAQIATYNLTKIYGEPSNQTIAINNVSLEIEKGEFIAIIGASGSGKSTLMNILGCLDKPTSGDYYLEGEQVSKFSTNKLAHIRNQKIGFVFQSFNLLARTTALKNVALPLIYAKVEKSERERRARDMLAKVGLSDKLSSNPQQLSGGQQQRVAIARALINNPDIIFADEPTGNLDTKSSKEIMDILKNLNNEGKTIVVITHETEIASLTKRIITIRDGQIVSDQMIKNGH